jgi:predicted CXXCH cytochrome family protein
LLGAVLLCVLVAGSAWGRDVDAESVGATYVGRAACAPCHAEETAAYAGSHHDRAMQPADSTTVLGNFGGTRFTYAGVVTTFSRRGDAYWVRTDGADGKLHDYRVAYTFGVDPLQQYLIELPGGRVQALGIAWDTRPKAEGGQRWFHLYPEDKVDSRDVLHWTGPAQNWNHMCAECHSTDVRKNYDAATEQFATRWSEIDVSCEACHGPGSRHIAWAEKRPAADDRTKGFDARLAPGQGAFVLEAGAPIARLAGPRDTSAQIDTCGRCHSRRAQISEDWRPGQRLAQTHRVALLDEGLYQADGQILDEVYEYGSFLQSRMHAGGVACTDCHDPHSGLLRAEGNALCATCHAPATYDVTAHHHHRQGTAGASCVACHMPSRLYMVVDRRHDHGFRVPRPDLTVALGTPNACADCHHDHPASWAAEAIVNWYGPTRTRGPTWARAVAAGRGWEAGAEQLLAEAAVQPGTPSIVRATAIELLSRFPAAVQPSLMERAVADGDPLVRRSSLALLVAVEPSKRWDMGSPLVSDTVRTVRLEAVDGLAGAPVPAAQQSTFDRTVKEYRAAQAFNADRADSWLNLGALDARLGDPATAETDYRRAMRLQPSFMPSYVNLADLYRAQGRDRDGEKVLREALGREAGAAEVHYALGLLLVRSGRRGDAVAELARAAALAPDMPRYAYAYALGLHGTSERAKALSVLAAAQGRFTGDRDILVALVQLSVEAGEQETAARWGQKLQALDRRVPR